MSKRNESIVLKFAGMIVIKRNHQDAARRKEQKKQNHKGAARCKKQKEVQ
ncbi:hypothetical protein ML436_04490 [Staphylococcus roterodami]|nr:hypothetical protein ML436_04490 [Staphylococcus roterodami]